MGNHADMDDLVDLQRNRNNILAAQIGRTNAGRDGIAIRAGHQIDDCAFIRYLDALFMVQRREDFLRIIE